MLIIEFAIQLVINRNNIHFEQTKKFIINAYNYKKIIIIFFVLFFY